MDRRHPRSPIRPAEASDDLMMARRISPALALHVLELEDAIGHLLETIENLGGEKVERFWPEFEGWAAGLSPEADGHCACIEPDQCICCEVISISAVAADMIDPDGERPEGWRTKIRRGTPSKVDDDDIGVDI